MRVTIGQERMGVGYRTRGFVPGLVLALAVALAGCSASDDAGNGNPAGPDVGTPGPDVEAPFGDVQGPPLSGEFFSEKDMRAQWNGERLRVDVTVGQAGEAAHDCAVVVMLRGVDGTFVDQARITAKGAGRETSSVQLAGLPADTEAADLVAYNLDYLVACTQGQMSGRRSVFAALEQVETQLLGADRLPTDGTANLWLAARDPLSGEPLANADVSVELALEDGSLLELTAAQTDAHGIVSLAAPLPQDFQGSANLRVIVDREGDGVVDDEAVAPVTVEPQARVLLTTDKPLYQPGQTMHIRTLALDPADKTPLAGEALILEIADAKGNKVFKQLLTASEHGIAAADFRLARQVNLGEYRLKAILGAYEVEKQVTVDRYVLPKYKVALSLDQAYYRPGDTVQGTVQARYFFGQPVAGGAVVVKAATFDIGFTEFATVSGTTNDEGLFGFTFRMPDYVVGQPLEQGKGMVKVEVTVTDLADHEQTLTQTTVVAEADVEAVLVPESGDLVPGVENVVYVVLSDPIGGPVEASATVTIADVAYPVTFSEPGLGRFAFVPAGDAVQAVVAVTPVEGDPVTTEATLTTASGPGEHVLLRTDRAVYAAGDTVQATILAPSARDRVYTDIVKAGQTLQTLAVDIESGHGSWSFPVDETMEGMLALHVYYLGAKSAIVRDERLIYVEAASELALTMEPDREIYQPGDEARVAIRVTDDAGLPQVAALGIQVVDEAVFALQETQPGLLKTYFDIEADILNPRYQFKWPDLGVDDVINEDADGLTPDETVAHRERAAVAFAASAGTAGGVNVNTLDTRVKGALQVIQPLFKADVDALIDAVANWGWNQPDLDWGEDGIDALWEHLLSLGERDFWRQPYRYERHSDGTFRVYSSGPDETAGTSDDLSADVNQWDLRYGRNGGGEWGDDVDFDGGGPWPGGPPMEGGGEEPTAEPGGGHGTDEGGSATAVRVRRYFPETLFVEPELLTDENGLAEVQLRMADSITEWRMTALASSTDGLLGSGTRGITVFQDFFVDIDFPATLTRNDRITVPVAVYNYLDVPQTVTITLQPASWMELSGGGEVVIPLDAGEVDAVEFELRALEVGTHALTAMAMGTAMNDAVERTVLVTPDGKEFTTSASARFHTEAPPDEPTTEEVVKTVSIPTENIDGAQTLLVKVYPGFFSQCVEGLDSMLQLPTGCLEQTTSSAWPNVLALKYMLATETATPETELKAREYINLGYQRILTFECASGGFNWWEGDDPGNAVLSGVVINMLRDTSDVAFVDEAVITRTQQWLADRQRDDGSWGEETHLHAGNENLGAGSLRATAYITWSLARSGYEGPALAAAVSYLHANVATETDLYTVAMVANALATVSQSDPMLTTLVQRLHDARVEEEGGLVHWSAEGSTMVGSWGDNADIETTALVGLALLHAGAFPTDVEGAVSWLIANKDPQGNWGYSTQATVLTLKLLIESLMGDAGNTAAEVSVVFGGEVVATRTFDNFNKDVLWQVDLSDLAIEGDNAVTLRYEGIGGLMYQIVGGYYLPWEETEPTGNGPLTITVEYDRTELAVNDTVTVTVTVANSDPLLTGSVMVDLGLPPGFTLNVDDLAALRAAGTISEYEFTDRQLLIYLSGVPVEEAVTFQYRLTADYPLEAEAPASQAYPYYNQDERTETPPVDLHVE